MWEGDAGSPGVPCTKAGVNPRSSLWPEQAEIATRPFQLVNRPGVARLGLREVARPQRNCWLCGALRERREFPLDTFITPHHALGKMANIWPFDLMHAGQSIPLCDSLHG